MWVTREVHIPKNLLEAQRQGRLVVFAGAGVSMGAPSNLPDFKRLALEIAGGTETPADDEVIERFLGRLASQGVKVHERARQILTPMTSRPTSLHFKLVSLFYPHPLRIVTTNFDHHFTTVLAETDLTATDVYYSPALPLGGDFEGLVYLHGSVDKKPKDMILTDSDFGKAYLTDGWIARFLPDMFARYAVLFVGYSHTDTVMHYLARGLPPGTSRYALTEETPTTRWKSLGIEPIPFPLREGADSYGEVRDAIAAWVDSSSRSPLQREASIRDVVESQGPIGPVEEGIIRDALDNPTDTRFFIRYTKTSDWLHRVARYGVLDDLFRPDASIDETKRLLAWWIAQHYICKFPDAVLSIIEQKGPFLHSVFWNEIVNQLTYHDPPPDPRTRLMWSTLLLNSIPPQADRTALSHMLHECDPIAEKDLVLLLLEYLTKPTLKSWRKERSELTTQGNSTWLGEAWRTTISPSIGVLACDLMHILSSNLRQAYALLEAFDDQNRRWDPLNLRKELLDAQEEPGYEEGFDFVIEAADEVITWLAEHQPQYAAGMIATWSDSEYPLLQRLSVKGMSQYQNAGADARIEWLLQRDWLFNWQMKSEVFHLLQRAYPQSSQLVRERLLTRILQGQSSERDTDSENGSNQYEIYNLLVWLRKIAPECALANQSFEEMQASHPEFAPREHPERDFGFSTFESHQPNSPLDVETLLARNPAELVGFLLTFQGDWVDGPDRSGLLSAVGEASATSLDWSFQLAHVLRDDDRWVSDVSEAVISGWRRSVFTDQQLAAVLQFLIQASEFSHPITSVPDMILHAVEKSSEPLSPSTLALAESLTDHIWIDMEQKEPGGNVSGDVDWLTIAINHTGGIIVQIWIQLLSKKLAMTASGTTPLVPEDYRQRFERVLSGTSITSEVGRVILASQIRYLFSIDAKWTVEHILPIFDWLLDEQRAEQAWDGYLTWGRFDNALLAELLPMYERSFDYLESRLHNKADRFCTHLADIALYTPFDPSQTSWLDRFLRAANGQMRGAWATRVGQRLSTMNDEQRQGVWTKWLDLYWSRRLTGLPLLLGDQEKEAMVLWSLSLGEVFPAAVPHILKTPAPGMLHHMIYRRLRETGVADSYPNAVTDLCDHLLSSAARPFWECADVGMIVEIAAKAHVSTRRLLSICNKLAALGCENASSLAKSLADVDGQT